MSDKLQIDYQGVLGEWSAYYDPEGIVGRGKTREDALIDLLEQTDEGWRKALDERDAAKRGFSEAQNDLIAINDRWTMCFKVATGCSDVRHETALYHADRHAKEVESYAEYAVTLTDAALPAVMDLESILAAPQITEFISLRLCKLYAAHAVELRAALAKNPSTQEGALPKLPGEQVQAGSSTPQEGSAEPGARQANAQPTDVKSNERRLLVQIARDLRRYGNHDNLCESLIVEPTHPCNCGFTQALLRADSPLPPEVKLMVARPIPATFAGSTLSELRSLKPRPGTEQTVATIHALVGEIDRLGGAAQIAEGGP